MRKLKKPWIESYLINAKHVAAPKSYHLWTAIATISGALERKVWVEFPIYKVRWYPSLYVLLIGPPGTRKGTAINIGEGMLRSVPKLNVLASNITAEAIPTRMKEHEKRYMLGDKRMSHHSAIIVAEELPALIKPRADNRDTIVTLAKLWNCDDVFHKDTKHSGTEFLTNPYLTILAGVTPDMLRLSVPVEIVGSGLTSRMVIVYEKSVVKSPPLTTGASELIDMDEDLLHDLIEINKMVGQFIWPVEVSDWYDGWWKKYEETAERLNDNPMVAEYIREHFSRKPTMLWRVAMIHSVSRGDALEITVEDMKFADKVLTETEEGFKSVFSSVGILDAKRFKLVSRVREIVGKTPGISEAKLKGYLLGDASGEDVNHILNALIAAGEMTAEGSIGKRLLRSV